MIPLDLHHPRQCFNGRTLIQIWFEILDNLFFLGSLKRYCTVQILVDTNWLCVVILVTTIGLLGVASMVPVM
jgi:hypothetical protein